MTEGRFETTFNLRPNGWDARYHWTATHGSIIKDPEHRVDHMERESCPFHDLRADGCFQPEYAGLGVEGSHLEPGMLVQRPDGTRMSCGGLGAQPKFRGVGGRPIAFDVAPAPEPRASGFRSGRPWTATKKFRNLFSTFEHMCDVPDKLPDKTKPVQSFQSGWNPQLIGAHQRHVPEPYTDPDIRGRPAFRLRCGTVVRSSSAIAPLNPRDGAAIAPHNADGFLKGAPPAARPASAPRAVYQANKPHKGAFQPFPPHMSDPWAPAGIKTNRRPLFTYAAKTKRCMPVQVPWKAGLSSAEPLKAAQRD